MARLIVTKVWRRNGRITALDCLDMSRHPSNVPAGKAIGDINGRVHTYYVTMGGGRTHDVEVVDGPIVPELRIHEDWMTRDHVVDLPP